ncbi:quinone oxidoreductase family protein [Spirosoma utsteinense]|uniref:NADPH:quinone reductase-like Zn-dependent oxidoreductase n=1 Tax=Spirosoma utsteinense TaxID=2585773 RepID=A0ABR6W2Y8_9BACT|nr:zinc-binding dehydrogenase [Spirosoma utsteinense]MBC3783751.1 NADPH:quinone reductase-like Zn-dependent oxidoreductase [Spirosoma utsteinense]MBC3790105.1 NADPH:quinone reductase-like Zn-dependent oxidoreductase [Spirosoma utsteinense]
MRAILLSETHQPVQLVDAPAPTAGPGEVVVNIRAAALNHRDVFIQKGLYPGIKLPVILGSDGAGVVSSVGEGVDPVWRGQEVIINCSQNWGPNPKFYGPDFKILGMPDNGTFAEYIAVPATYIHHKPAHLTFEQAAALPLAGLTAWRALMTRAGLHTNGNNEPEKVLLTGIGGGAALFALQFAVGAGADVWVTSGSDEKIEKAIAMGAKGGVNYREPDWAKTLMAKTGGGRTGHALKGYFDVIIDSAGGAGFGKLVDVAAMGGRIAIFGGTTGNLSDIAPSKVFFKQLVIVGSTMGTEREFADMIAFVNAKKVVPTVDEVFALSDVEAAMRRMDEGKQFGKIVLKIDE